MKIFDRLGLSLSYEPMNSRWVSIEDLEAEIQASIRRLEKADRTAYGKAVLVELLQTLSQNKTESKQ